jgi:hypothetical protein
LRAGTLLLVLVALGGFLDADSNSRGSYYQDVNGYDNPYGSVQDVFVYDQQGRLLNGVRLFDQNGQSIRLGWRDCGYREEPPFESGTDSEPAQMPRSIEGVYPYCPENAPFRMPSAEVPSPSPSSSAGAPSPSVSAAVPSPSVSGGPSVAPRPSGTR